MHRLSHIRLSIFALSALCYWAVNISYAFAAVEMHTVPVLAQPMARGEIIRDESLASLEIKRSPAGIDYITHSSALIGMAAKRPLRAGVPLRISDVAPPQIIKKNDLVTIAFEAPGLSLSIRGKALDDGIYGKTIRVMNTQTNRVFEGVTAAAGYVLVSPLETRSPAASQSSNLHISPSTAALNGE